MKAAITFDIDWAPDCAIDLASNLLAERGVKSTWFVTHLSPAVERLRARPDLFELGIHPNFMPGSSHGEDPEQVLRTCMELVPDAVSVRTHGLLQSGNIFDFLMALTPVTFDVSLFHPRALQIDVVKYERFGQTLWRVPYVWEDDYVMESSPLNVSREPEFSGFSETLARARGIQVFNFHPIHVLLNSNVMDNYNAMKRNYSRLADITPALAAPFIETERSGAKTALVALAEAVSTRGGGSFIREFRG
ncbi:hypothetical protein ASC80_02595 [Afipia sp. Root123D2]|uniref:polysaccharide deacetylase WbmS family protein n=1 Tax=Afipia sp. Root123D2 TaxID=1736436 RepID=UPI0006F6F08D|nr:hypothetical protein [Afipia sp. Root123D2]KQW22301.1 hypothetical protein ASC80_02595 [Afipia sp. Root123D2]